MNISYDSYPDSCKSVCHGERRVEKDLIPLCAEFNCDGNMFCERCRSCLDEMHFNQISLSYASCSSSKIPGSLFYYLPFMVTTLFSGYFSNLQSIRSRKFFIILSSLSSAVIASSYTMLKTFRELVLLRILLGVVQAVSTPISLSLISDIFPNPVQAEKYSIFSFGVYLGDLAVGITPVLSDWMGFKNAFFLVSLLTTVCAGLLSFTETRALEKYRSEEDDFLLKACEREGHSYATFKNRKESEENIKTDVHFHSTSDAIDRYGSFRRVFLFFFIAIGFRVFGTYINQNFLPLYLTRRFPKQDQMYGVLVSVLMGSLGSISAYFGGTLSDKLNTSCDESYRAKIPAVGAILALFPLSFLFRTDNFFLAIFFLGCETFLAECWYGSVLALLQNLSDEFGKTAKRDGIGYTKGDLFSIFLFLGNLCGSLGAVMFELLDNKKSFETFQVALFLTLIFSYLGSFVMFIALSKNLRYLNKKHYMRNG